MPRRDADLVDEEIIMGKYSGVILFSDFDGTFYYGRGNCAPKENIDAVRYFQENGGRFTLATGRYPHILHRFADKVGGIMANAPIIAGNGALVYDFEQERELFSTCVTSDLTPAILELAKHEELFDVVDFFPREPWASVEVRREDTDTIKSIMENSPHKMYFHIKVDRDDRELALKQSDEAKALIRSCVSDKYDIVRASLAGIEILPHGITKGMHVRPIAESLGCDKIICVGDYENDTPMIIEADIGYAMGNAHPSLFEVADRIAPRFEDAAIAKIIYEL